MSRNFLNAAPLLLTLCLLRASGWTQETKAKTDEPKGSFLQHRLQIEVEQEQVPVEGGKVGLQLNVKVINKEHLIVYKDLEIQSIVAGRYGGPKKRLQGRKERMVLNQTERFNLEAGKSFIFESRIMESGRGDPEHPHYGVFYEGYLVVVKDSFGKIVASDCNFAPLSGRYPEIKDVPEGEDFRAHVLINR